MTSAARHSIGKSCDGLGRLERMLARYQNPRDASRYFHREEQWEAEQRLSEALRSVAPELIQIARKADDAWRTQPGEGDDFPTRATWEALTDALAALARKLDGLPEEKPDVAR